jgi:hypothetical protein
MLDTTMRRDVIERRHIQDASDDTRALGSFSSPTRDDAAERAQFHTNNRRWSWLIMHYRGGVLQLLFFCFLLFREPCYFASFSLSLSVGLCLLDITNQRDGFEADQVRTGFFYLLSPGKIYTTVAFWFLGLVLFILLCFCYSTTPCATAVHLLDQLPCGWPCVLATRPRLFLYRERERETTCFLFYSFRLPIDSLTTRFLPSERSV